MKDSAEKGRRLGQRLFELYFSGDAFSGGLVRSKQVIGKMIERKPVDILSNEPVVVNFYGPHGSAAPYGTIENSHAGQKELYEKMRANKDEEIARMQKIIDSLLLRK